MPASLNGWTVLEARSDPRLATGRIPGTTRRITMRADVLPLFLALAADYHRWVAPIDVGELDDAGYNYRKARTVDRWSNHASGTALDLNWRTNMPGSPRARKFYAQPVKEAAMRRLLRIYDIVDWGGDWNMRDYMHFELKPGTTPQRVQRLIRRLGITPEGVRTRTRFGTVIPVAQRPK